MRYLLSALMVLLFAVSASADYREKFEKEFLLKTWDVQAAKESACITCHTSEIMKPAFQRIPNDWQMSWHFKNDVSCHDCHGGDFKDPGMSMSHQRGFVGKPGYADVPQFCGKCHIGILRNYVDSGHGKALKSSGEGPNCVTCHGSHNIQKADIDIVNVRVCTQCHSFERARTMKQALFATENQIKEIEKNIALLKSAGIYVEEINRELFSNQAEFRALFHTIDVDLVKNRTDEFTRKFGVIDAEIQETFEEITFRKNFAAFLTILFICMAGVVYLLAKTHEE